jgi:hypothetical protein
LIPKLGFSRFVGKTPADQRRHLFAVGHVVVLTEAEPGHVPMDLPESRVVTDGLPFAPAAILARQTANAPTSLAAAGPGKMGVFDVTRCVEKFIRII